MDHMTARRKESWRDFYEGKRNTLVLIHRDFGPRPWPYPENKKERIAFSLRMYRDQMEALHWLADDHVPYLCPYTGTEIFARAFGCAVHRPKADMPFALPMIRSSAEAAHLRLPTLEQESLAEVFEIADALRAEEPEAVMALPDIQSPLDIAALLWEKADFFAAMLEEPEAVQAVISLTQQLLTDFLDAWFARYDKELVAHYPDYYLPEGVTLSEDEVGTISPAAFREFSAQSINLLSARYGGIGIHCCANSYHQWENFRGIQGLRLLNLCQPSEVSAMAYPFFRDTCGQAHGIPQICREGSDLLLDRTGLCKGARMVLQGYTDNRKDAAEMAARLRALALEFEE